MRPHLIESVLITGAGRGLGLSLARRFLREGMRVFAGQHIVDVHLSGLVESFPQTVTPIPLDVRRMDSVCQAARRVAELTPSLDVLINNAAVMLETDAPLPELDLSSLPLVETLEVNAFGPLRMVQQFLPLLEKGNRRLILNVSSEAGSIADCWRQSQFAYCMSKAALNMQSKILHNYLGPLGFTVLVVHPGWMRTDMGGAEADIHPDEAADCLFNLALRDRKPEDEIYLDYQGRPLRW